MSNTPRLKPGPPVVPQGDMGIGLCLICLGEAATGGQRMPSFAVTFAPMLWPPTKPVGLVAVPGCWEHVRQFAQQLASPKKPLLVAQGGMQP